jgi:CRP-like cAMP-binding protein
MHSRKSKERVHQPIREKADVLAISMVMAKQYNLENTKIRTKVLPNMLKAIGIFRSLSKETLKNLAEHFVSKSYHNHDKIIQQGTVGTKLFILLHGIVGIHVEGVGVVNQVYPYAAFGERSLLMHQKTSATCFAFGPCLVAHITREMFDEVLGGMAADLESMTRLRSTIQDSMKSKDARMSGVDERVMMRIGMFQMKFKARLELKRRKKAALRKETLKKWSKVAWLTRCIAISRSWCFRKVRPDTIGKVATCSFVKRFQKNEKLYVQKEWAKYCYIILRGTVELRAKPQRTSGKHAAPSRLLASLGPRMIFGDLEIVPDGDAPGYRRRCCMARTVTSCDLLLIPYEAVLWVHTVLAHYESLAQRESLDDGDEDEETTRNEEPRVPRSILRGGRPLPNNQEMECFESILRSSVSIIDSGGSNLKNNLGCDIGGPLKLMRNHAILDSLPSIEEILCCLCVRPKVYRPRSTVTVDHLVFIVSGTCNVLLNGKVVSKVSDGSVFRRDQKEDVGVELISETIVDILEMEMANLDLLNMLAIKQLNNAISLPKVWRKVTSQMPTMVPEKFSMKRPLSRDPWMQCQRATNPVRAPPTWIPQSRPRAKSQQSSRRAVNPRTKRVSQKEVQKVMNAMQLPSMFLVPNKSAASANAGPNRPQTVPEPQYEKGPAIAGFAPGGDKAVSLRRPRRPKRRQSAVMDLQQKFRALRRSGALRTKNVVEGMAISSLNTRKHVVLKLRPVSIVVPAKPIAYKFPNRKKKINPRGNMKIW